MKIYTLIRLVVYKWVTNNLVVPRVRPDVVDHAMIQGRPFAYGG